MTILVIGAGLAGVTCARRLMDSGQDVLLLDKARGSGGRSSTRRAGGVRFDHGASSVYAKTDAFAAVLAEWERAGVVAPWPGSVARLTCGQAEVLEHPAQYVGVPGMSAILRHASQGLTIRYASRVASAERFAGSWRLTLEDGERLGPFELLVSAVPAPQAVPLLSAAPRLAARVDAVQMDPCWSLLVHFARRPPREWTTARGTGGVFESIVREHSKPERSSDAAWVAHASQAWSLRNLEASAEEARGLLLARLGALAGPLPPIRYAAAHRWRYAKAREPLGEAFLFDPTLGLGVCGDWCLGRRLEDAYLSGSGLGARLAVHTKRRSAG